MDGAMYLLKNTVFIYINFSVGQRHTEKKDKTF